MRIIILSDSLGRPRPDISEKERTTYKDTYFYKVKEHFRGVHDVDIFYIESLDTQDAIFWSQRMVAFREPDLVIYHLGINDCVPRIFKKGSRSLLLDSWFRKLTRDLFMKIIHKYRFFITRLIRKTYTDKKKFKLNMLKMLDDVRIYNREVKFLCISIAKASNELNSRSFGVNENIESYNQILKNIFKDGFVDVNNLLPSKELLISDGIHLTKKAHNLLGDKIIELIEGGI